MKTLIAASAAALAIIAASPAQAHVGGGYWTAATARNAVLNSDWAAEWGIDSAVCVGRGGAVKNAQGKRTYRHFLCDFYRDFDAESWPQQGQLHVLPGAVKWQMVLVTEYGVVKSVYGTLYPDDGDDADSP